MGLNRIFLKNSGLKLSRLAIPKIIHALVLVTACLLLTNCAPSDQVNMLERRVNSLSMENRTLAKRIESLQREIGAIKAATEKVGKKDIASMRSKQADFGNRLEELQGELLRLNGMIDEINHRDETREEETKKFREGIEARITKLMEEVKLLQQSATAAKKAEETRKKVAERGIDLYQQALDLIKEKKFKDAKKTLQAYIEQHPRGDRVPNAYFWMGDCEYNMQRYEEAILDYQKVISKYPKSNKVPDALLKQGFAFAKLGDNESAKIVLNKLLKKYPKSPQAKWAKKQLARLK